MTSLKQNNSFWKILHGNEIIIPTIQRDYAYGRDEAKGILANLLQCIKSALDEESVTQLHLAFVYGKLEGKQNDELLERNAENIRTLLKSVKEYANNLDIIVDIDTHKDVTKLTDNVRFIPIDGQQRLTTLYLLHWYLAMQINEKEGLNLLCKFSYATRISSKEFSKFLCEMKFDASNGELNSHFVVNQEGYFKQWSNDPTVKNMLVVIDQINAIFKTNISEFKNYWKLLTETEKICFDFFDLNDFQLTDELYVKMNSRGKRLTQFENFKAWLYGQKTEITHDIKKDIDIKWYDLFWKAQSDEGKDIDDAYLQWFKSLLLADFLKMKATEQSEAGLKDNLDLTTLANNHTSDLRSIKSIIGILRSTDSRFLDLLHVNTEISHLLLQKIESYLQMLGKVALGYSSKLYLNTNKLYFGGTINELIFKENESLNWWQFTLQYSVMVYAGTVEHEEQSFNDYLRIISNLIFNTPIDSPEDYLQAIRSIDSIIEFSEGKALKYFAEQSPDNISFFSSVQKVEEKIKAGKCQDKVQGDDWKKAITIAEQHPYFYGQIGFLIDLLEDGNSVSEFMQLFEKVGLLFSEEVLQRNDYLLLRTFLTQGDCLYSNGDIKLFYSNVRNTLRNRTENWRRFFSHFKTYIKKVVSHEYFSKDHVIDSLIEIIEDDREQVKDLYAAPFINHPFLFNYPKRNCIRLLDNNCYLLNSTRMSGKYVEILTYLWFNTSRSEFVSNNPEFQIEYKVARGFNDEPGLEISYSGADYKLEREHTTGKFTLSGRGDKCDDLEELILSLIENDNADQN